MGCKLIIGNWKMNLELDSSLTLVEQINAGLCGPGDCEVVICPPHIYLMAIGERLASTRIGLGAQNMYFEPAGAFTGEVSASMLREAGCKYVILGHSERRHVMGEDDVLIGKKVHAALTAALEPILCVGEMLEQRKASHTETVVGEQLKLGLHGVTERQFENMVIAYEPVWAIGTGVNATPEQVQQVHAYIRGQLASTFGSGPAACVRILYGGSVKASNAVDLIAQADVDGVLVGGASLKADEFLGIINSHVGTHHV